MTLTARIFAHARASPDKLAASHNGRPISYGQLAASIALARRGFARGEGWRDQIAVVCVGNLLADWILRLALQSLGATTISIRGAEDIAPLAIGPAVVISNSGEARLAPAAVAGGHTLLPVPPDLFAPWRQVDLRDDAPAMDNADGAHVLLTSGTTGVYKKVRHDTASQAQVIALNLALGGVGPDSVFGLFNFPGWTGANYVWAAITWHVGGQVMFHQGPERWRPLANPGLTHAMVTPQMLVELLGAATETFPPRKSRPRLFVTGGVLPESQWRVARDRLSVDLWSVYGATETANLAFTRLEHPDDLITQHIHAPDRIQVVDDDGRPTPPGHIGRVRLRVTGPTRYLDDPVASAAFFQDGFFYPGDLGLLREDGRLILQGRSTDVINVMGAKIATLPIETMLQDRFGAQAVCVFSVPGETGESVHIAVQSPDPLDAAAIEAAFAAAAAGAGPVRIHAVQAMPRNTMGKIERAKLKASLLG